MRSFFAALALLLCPSLAWGQATCVGDLCGSAASGPYQTITSLAVSGSVTGSNTGISPLSNVAAATAAVMPGTPVYSNGASGVGAQLAATTNGALVVDGYTAALGDRILVRNQTLSYQNGIYIVNQTGGASTAYIVTRASDLQTGSQFFHGITTMATNGTANAGVSFVMVSNGVFTVGQTGNTWTAFTTTISGTVAGGDLSGTYPSPTVAKINGVALGSTTATAGNVLVASGTNWVTKTISGDAALSSGGALTVSKIGGVAISLAGAFTQSGAFATTLTSTATTNSTLPAGTHSLAPLDSPSFTTPTLGVATATSINKVALTAPATGSTLTIADGKTLTASKTMTLTAAGDSAVITLPNATATALSTAGAILQAAPSNPSGTTSAVGVMMGLGSTCAITPVYSSRVFFWIQGTWNNNTANDGANMQLRYGTGAAPANAATATGTNPYGGSANAATMVNNASTAAADFSFHASGIASGLTPGTAIWFDADLSAITGGTAQLLNVSCGAYEM